MSSRFWRFLLIASAFVLAAAVLGVGAAHLAHQAQQPVALEIADAVRQA